MYLYICIFWCWNQLEFKLCCRNSKLINDRQLRVEMETHSESDWWFNTPRIYRNGEEECRIYSCFNVLRGMWLTCSEILQMPWSLLILNLKVIVHAVKFWAELVISCISSIQKLIMIRLFLKFFFEITCVYWFLFIKM